VTSPGPSAWLRSRSSALLAILALQTGAGLVVGFWILFSRFQPYDDESTFLLWDRHLLQGYALYDEVWSFFGPFPFLVRWLLHGLLGAPLTHEVVRLATLALWLAAAALLALAVYRMTRRLLLSALAHALVLLGLTPHLEARRTPGACSGSSSRPLRESTRRA